MESIEVLILFFPSFIYWIYLLQICMCVAMHDLCVTWIKLLTLPINKWHCKGLNGPVCVQCFGFTPTFSSIFCHCGGFFHIGPGLGPFPPLSDSPFYSLHWHQCWLNVITWSKTNYGFVSLSCLLAHKLYTAVLFVPNDNSPLAVPLGPSIDMLT